MNDRFIPYIQIDGDGDPIVMVHGGWTDHTSWQVAAPALAIDNLVLTYDRRGHSLSAWSGDPVPRRVDEDDLVEIIQVLDRGPVHLIGNSYGASIALTVAARRPDLVRSVVAHEPPLLGVGRPGTPLGHTRDEIRRLLSGVAADLERGEVEAGARRFVEDVALGPGAWSMLPVDIRTAMLANAPTFLGTLQDPTWDEVTVIPDRSVPVLLTDGTDSPAWLPAVVGELEVSHYGHALRHTFDGAGHVPHLTHPHDFVTVVQGFVRSAAGGAVISAVPSNDR